MDKDLTASQIDRQNILYNDAALAEIQQQTNIKRFLFEEKLCVTKSMGATYFEVDIRTIERYVSENQGELTENGYEILKWTDHGLLFMKMLSDSTGQKQGREIHVVRNIGNKQQACCFAAEVWADFPANMKISE